MKSLKILTLAAESAPLVKVGGLGDVVGALPRALRVDGHDVRVAVPHYSVLHTPHASRLTQTNLQIRWNDAPAPATVNEQMVRDVPHWIIGGELISAAQGIYGPDAILEADKFVFFGMATLAAARKIGFRPDVLHVHDAHGGAAIYWLAQQGRSDPFWQRTATALTIHNLPFQMTNSGRALACAGVPAVADADIPADRRDALLALAIRHATVLNAVSPTYAEEILHAEGGAGLEHLLRLRADRLTGILNGLDYESWSPAADPVLKRRFDLESIPLRAENKRFLQRQCALPEIDAPLLAVVSRLEYQKGLELLPETLEPLLRKQAAQIVILGTGAPEIERALSTLRKRYPDRVGLFLRFDADRARQIYGGADGFLMPSRYEPCGIAQMIALRYGAVPVVHATGGLRDTVIDYDAHWEQSTGFVFEGLSVKSFRSALERALTVYQDKHRWRDLQRRGMRTRFSWAQSAVGYADLYAAALE